MAIMAGQAGRRGAWLTLLASMAGVAAVFAVGVDGADGGAPQPPQAAESTRATQLQQRLPERQVNPALVVYARGGERLTEADLAAASADVEALRPLAAADGRVPPPVVADDETAALVSVPLPANLRGEELAAAVDQVRDVVRSGLPAGATAQVTGAAGFAADLSAVFQGADTSLLLVTTAVVALLLLVTYRSPWLWLVPLIVVLTGDQVAARLLRIVSGATGLTIDGSATGIASVLVFGAGTNYALLLISRYREELRSVEDRHQAMRRALRAAGPAVVASAATVTLSLLTLVFADLTSNRTVGIAGAIGIAVALLFAMVVLPAALVVFGRWLFWPFVPRLGQANPTDTGVWARVGRVVATRPRLVVAGTVVLLGTLALGLVGANFGLAQTEQFRTKAESVEGLRTLSRSFPAGAATPVAVLTTGARADDVVRVAAAVPGVASARLAGMSAAADAPGGVTGPAGTAKSAGPSDVVQVDVVLTTEGGTAAADEAIRSLRSDLDRVDPDALVGGVAAEDLDTRVAAGRDQIVIGSMILAVVTIVLCLLLRSVVAALLLVATVIASFFAALGAGHLLFTTVFDFPAIDYGVPLLAFLFLVALGVDYNIFLTTRAREEAARVGTREGILRALRVTGGIITSAGILLAAVFTVLGVLPLIVLTQIGVIVGIGVLLDTVLVRSVLVPALVLLAGERFWWPSRPSRRVGGPGAAPPVAETVPVSVGQLG
jgi:RND superfamily putative drug exporter